MCAKIKINETIIIYVGFKFIDNIYDNIGFEFIMVVNEVLEYQGKQILINFIEVEYYDML